MRAVISAVCLIGLVSAAAPAPLEAQKVMMLRDVELSAEQKKAMHWGCVNACGPNPMEQKCATECEAAMYKCIDETGPTETPEDTKTCQAKVLKLYEETKGSKKEEKKADEKEDKKEGAKKEDKKAKKFMQLFHDGEDSEAADGGADVESEEATEDVTEASEDAQEASEDADDTGASLEASEDAWEKSEDAQEASEDADDTQEETASDEAEASEEETASDETEEETPTSQGESLMQTHKGSDDDKTEETETAPVEEAADQPHPALQSTEDFDNDFVQDENSDTGDWQAAKATKEAETSEEAEDSEDEAAEPQDEAAEALVQVGSSWKPEPCGELEPGVPCTKLYEHPQGSTFVTACPVGDQTNPESCGAYFGEKAAADQCPQITCPKALGVTMKLVCGGGCCPSCWAPDHVIKLDRHTTVDDAAVVDSAPQAPSTCGGVKCFKLACAAGFTEGFVNGACCNSCVQGR